MPWHARPYRREKHSGGGGRARRDDLALATQPNVVERLDRGRPPRPSASVREVSRVAQMKKRQPPTGIKSEHIFQLIRTRIFI